jgi:hypothetical protein
MARGPWRTIESREACGAAPRKLTARRRGSDDDPIYQNLLPRAVGHAAALELIRRAARELDPENLPPDLAREAVRFWEKLQAASAAAAFRA